MGKINLNCQGGGENEGKKEFDREAHEVDIIEYVFPDRPGVTPPPPQFRYRCDHHTTSGPSMIEFGHFDPERIIAIMASMQASGSRKITISSTADPGREESRTVLTAVEIGTFAMDIKNNKKVAEAMQAIQYVGDISLRANELSEQLPGPNDHPEQME